MEYIEKQGNIERKYSLIYDEEELKKLLDEIIDRVSHKYSGKNCCFSDEIRCIDFEKKVYEMPERLPNGKPQFANVEFLYYFQSEGLGSYPHDSIAFNADVTYPPALAYIVGKILNNDPSGISEFLDYQNSEELIPIDQRIANAVKEVDAISTLDVDKKRDALAHLSYLMSMKKYHKYFDYDLLRQYYERANQLLSMQLVSETKKVESNKMLLKSFASTHKDFGIRGKSTDNN